MSSMLPTSSPNGGYPAPAPYRGGAPAPYANGGGLPEGGGHALGPKRYLLALLRYKWMIIAITVLGTAVGFAVTRYMQPLYVTSAQIWMDRVISGPAAPIRSGQLLSQSGWVDLIRSPTVLDSVIRKEQLYLAPSNPADSMMFAGFGLSGRFTPGMYTLALDERGTGYVLNDEGGAVVDRAAFGLPIGEDRGMAWTPPRTALAPGRSVEFHVYPPVDVFQELRQNLSVDLSEESPFMGVRLQGTDPERITRTLDAIVDRFEQIAILLKKERLSEQTAILQEQLGVAAKNLGAQESALKEFEINTATLPRDQGIQVLPGMQMQTNSAIADYFALTAQHDQLRRDREAIVRAIESDVIDVVTALEIIPSVRNSSLLSQALAAAAAQEASLRALRSQFTDEYRSVRLAINTLDSLKQVVIPNLAREQLLAMRQREGELQQDIQAAGGELQEIPEREIRQGQLQRNASIADEMYRDLESRLQGARLAEATAVPDLQVLSRPSVPHTPTEDTRRDMLLMFFGGSLGLGLLLAILRDRFDPRVRYPDQVTAGLGLNILGAVPALRRGKLGSTDMALAVESFRAIQLSLVHAHGAEAPLTVTFTSPGASDGKSFITSNLAIAFADMGHRTLVVDGDVRRGSLHQLLGTSHKPGLTDYLAGKAKRSEIVQQTHYPLLDVVGCGSRGEMGPKLLGSPAMAHLMEELRADYDVILVDSPPLGACVDPMILGTLTRNLVLVLRTGTTDRAMAESKLDVLDRLPVRVLGAILNDVTTEGPYRYYSYISGYEVIEEIDEGRDIRKLEEARSPS
ncbi:MAG: GumC family protein [Longimicrobiales bacterium]